MCGIAGIVSLDGAPVPRLEASLAVLDRLIAHRGPDGQGSWIVAVAARRARPSAPCDHRSERMRREQPMLAPGPTVISYNGEIYNYLELRESSGAGLGLSLDLGHRMHSCRL